MNCSGIKSIILVILWSSLLFIQTPTRMVPADERLECFMILAGKDTTIDGSVLLAHNNDLSGKEASLIEKFPRKQFEKGSVVRFPSGLAIPQAEETFAWMVLRIYKGFAEGDAVAVNEYGVAIAGGVALGDDRNPAAVLADPLKKEGLTGGVRYIALQRSKSARECVERIGSLYTRYGVTYPSGVGIADGQEIWYMESGGGSTWAAVRIPDNRIWVQANGYRIGNIDFSDGKNFLTSPGLKEFAIKKGLWDPAKGKFIFSRIFGRKKRDKGNRFYNSRRIWRGISLLAPSLNLHPDSEEFPQFIKPDLKVDLKTLFSILRDRYQGTSYINTDERAIAVKESVHTTVIQLRGWLPPEIGNVLWAGTGPTPVTSYIPFYFGIQKIPGPFARGGQYPEPGSAFWKFWKLNDLVTHRNVEQSVSVIKEWEKVEDTLIKQQKAIGNWFYGLSGKYKDSALKQLTSLTRSHGEQVLRKAEEMIIVLRKRAL